MIYEFKSRATGSVIMTKPVAEWMLQIVGKTPGRTGIITVEQMPAAIAALNRAIASEKEQLRASEAADDAAVARTGSDAGAAPMNGTRGADRKESGTDETDPYPVSLAQRAFPFIEMLESAHRAGKDVTWGV